jgi:hypothetical protein
MLGNVARRTDAEKMYTEEAPWSVEVLKLEDNDHVLQLLYR